MTHHTDELDVLIEQLDELLAEGASDADAALEIATVAGLAERLGAPPEVLAPAEAWRDGPGGPLLDEALAEVDLGEMVATIDEVSTGAEEEEVDDAISDFDDLVAAAVWARKPAVVRDAAKLVAAIIRELPDAFAFLSFDGKTMARTRTVAEDPSLYDYWLAIADAAEWLD